MNKDIKLELYLKVFKSKDEVTTGSIVSSDNKYYIVTGGVISKKYECFVHYCRELGTSSTKIFRKDQLEVVTFNADVFDRGKCLGTYTIDVDSIEKIDYTTKPQNVRGHISTYKRRARVGDTTLYPVTGTITSTVDNNIFVTEDKTSYQNAYNRSQITLTSKDSITTLRLVCPKCGK